MSDKNKRGVTREAECEGCEETGSCFLCNPAAEMESGISDIKRLKVLLMADFAEYDLKLTKEQRDEAVMLAERIDDERADLPDLCRKLKEEHEITENPKPNIEGMTDFEAANAYLSMLVGVGDTQKIIENIKIQIGRMERREREHFDFIHGSIEPRDKKLKELHIENEKLKTIFQYKNKSNSERFEGIKENCVKLNGHGYIEDFEFEYLEIIGAAKLMDMDVNELQEENEKLVEANAHKNAVIEDLQAELQKAAENEMRLLRAGDAALQDQAAKIERLESELAETSENLRRRNAETTRLKYELASRPEIVRCVKCRAYKTCEMQYGPDGFCSAGVEEGGNVPE